MRFESCILAIFSALAAVTTAANGFDYHEYEERDLFSGYFDPARVCGTMKSEWSQQTFMPLESRYKNITQAYYNSGAWNTPACVITPGSAEELSGIVRMLKKQNVPFAMKGAGHMPITNAASINSSGVLISSANLNQLQITPRHDTVNIGPGNKWSDVAKYLEPYKMTVAGGRLGVVGVPGYMLGGGVSFFGNEYGWASASVVSYTAVLANGDIVNATPNNTFSDLFWALRGGGNSFALVTNFEMKTIPLPQVALGNTNYGPDKADQFFDSVEGFAHDGGNDHKAAVIPLVQYNALLGGGKPQYTAFVFYNGNTTTPPALQNFTSRPDMPPVNTTLKMRPSYHNWTQEMDPQFDLLHGMRTRFRVTAIRADKTAMRIIHDTYFEAARAEMKSVLLFTAGVAFMPMLKNFFAASQVNGGDPMGVDQANAPYVWIEQAIVYANPLDDAKVQRFQQSVNDRITQKLKAYNPDVIAPFLYLNDADASQPVFEGYAKGSLERLKSIREKYDPDMVFTKLMPGGWKVSKAGSGGAEA